MAGVKRWPPELRQAIERRVLDEHESVAQAAREARGGQLRRTLAGEKLPPYDIPETSARYIVDAERERRKALLAEAVDLSDPAAAMDDLGLELVAELKREMRRMGRAIATKGRASKRDTAWAELQAAAKTLEAVKRATLGNGARSNVPVQSENGTDPPSFLQGLAGEKGRPSSDPTQQQKARAETTGAGAGPTTGQAGKAEAA
jgi:transposase-like protein